MKKRIALLLCGMSAASAVWATDTVNIVWGGDHFYIERETQENRCEPCSVRD